MTGRMPVMLIILIIIEAMKREMRNIHPGEILREEIIGANELTVTETAKMLAVSRQTLNKIIHK